MDMNNSCIIGIGNPLLTDDAVGIHAVRDLHKRLGKENVDVDSEELYACTLDLLSVIEKYERILLIDSIILKDKPYGSCLFFDISELDKYQNLYFTSTHGVNLSTIWEYGKRFELALPKKFCIAGITISDNQKEFNEMISEKLQKYYNTIIDTIEKKAIDFFS